LPSFIYVQTKASATGEEKIGASDENQKTGEKETEWEKKKKKSESKKKNHSATVTISFSRPFAVKDGGRRG